METAYGYMTVFTIAQLTLIQFVQHSNESLTYWVVRMQRLFSRQIAPLEWCKAPDVGLPAPDVVFYLKLPAKAAEMRADFGSERYENLEFQYEAEQQFEILRDSNWHELDASRDIESLHSEILRTAEKLIRTQSHMPLSSLWTSPDKE